MATAPTPRQGLVGPISSAESSSMSSGHHHHSTEGGDGVPAPAGYPQSIPYHQIPSGPGLLYQPQVYGQPYPYPPYAVPMYYPPPQGFNPADPVAYYMPQGYMQDGYYDTHTTSPPTYGNYGPPPPNMIPVIIPQNSGDPTFQISKPLPSNQYEYNSPPPQHAPPQHRSSVVSIQSSDRSSITSMNTPPASSGQQTPIQQGTPPSQSQSGQNASHSHRNSRHDDSHVYLPVIPASPLILQQQNIARAAAGAESALAKALEQRQDLSTIRRLTENVNVGKTRLGAAGKAIRDAQSKLLTDMTPKEMAVAITAFDFDMLDFIRTVDLVNYARDPVHPPYAIKSSLDFGYYIRRLVQITIVTPAIQTSRVRAIAHWIDIARELQKLRNFQSYGAIVSGLKSKCVQGLQITWFAVPKKYQQYWQDLRQSMSSDDTFRAYRQMLSTSRPPCIPRLDLFLHALAGPNCLEPGKREFEYYKSKPYSSELQGRDLGVQHWIVVHNWKSEERLIELSLKQEPPANTKIAAEQDKKDREKFLERLTRANAINDDDDSGVSSVTSSMGKLSTAPAHHT